MRWMMRVLLFGASGMVGQGVLRECLSSPDVEEVVAVVRRPLDLVAPKLREMVHADFFDWSTAENQLAAFDTCIFCLGVSVVGTTEADYRHTTYNLTLTVADAVLKASPEAVFLYISGRGTDSTGKGRMWARVKGETENALRAMPFRGVYCFRPGYIQPLPGMKSKVWWYNAVYTTLGWGYPMLRRFRPDVVTHSETVSRAMLRVAKDGWKSQVLETSDINVAGRF